MTNSIGHPYTLPTTIGWDINTHSLRVFLPEEIQTAWTTDIKEAFSTKFNTDTLKLLIGKLYHTAHIIPPARYFLNQIRHLLKRGKNWDRKGSNYVI